MLITTKLAVFGSIDFPDNFAKRSWQFWAQESENVSFFVQRLKSQTFSNSCAQNRHDLLAKIAEHIDGTSGAERGCNTDWTLEVVCIINNFI